MSTSQGMESVERLPMPSRNPIPLSAAQEQQVRDLYYKRVRDYCAEEIKRVYFSFSKTMNRPQTLPAMTDCASRGSPEFAACATGRTFTVTWACRPERLAMNSCMIARATREEQDAAREEWFALRLARRQEREAKEQRRKEQEKAHREWWGLPTSDATDQKERQSPPEKAP